MPRAIKIPQIETIIAIALTAAICLLLLSAVMDMPIELNLKQMKSDVSSYPPTADIRG